MTPKGSIVIREFLEFKGNHLWTERQEAHDPKGKRQAISPYFDGGKEIPVFFLLHKLIKEYNHSRDRE